MHLPESEEGPLHALAEFFKINAIKRVFSVVDVRPGEIVNLALLATAIALLEGLGLTLLLPVLQYAQLGEAAIQSGGAIWRVLDNFAHTVGIPLNLFTLLVLAFIPILLRQVAFYANAWYASVVSNRIALRMRVSTFSNMMAADPDFFAQRQVGELTGLVMGQTQMAGQTVLWVLNLFADVLILTIYVLLLVAISVPLTLITVVFAGLVALTVRRSVRRTRVFGEKVATITQQAYGAVVERLGLVRLVKMRAEEEHEIDRVRGFSEGLAKANVQVARLSASVEVTSDPLLMLAAFVTLYVGITYLGLQLAELGLLLFVLTRLNGKVKEFNAFRQAIASGVPAIVMLRDVAAGAAEADTIRGGARTLAHLREGVTFDDVHYEYPGADKVALRGMSAAVPAGSFTAIVGRSGAGKSTLVELVPRLKDTTSGSVRFDGVDVREFDLAQLRRGVGYLTQDPLLFNDTVRANLTYGLRREATDAEIESALRRAHAEFVLDMPKGLESVIGDRGLRVSGGERQRIALARVLLEDPDILVLDEPTSALDSESEHSIQAALHELHGEKTIIVIAHRLATVVAADQLLVMEDGRIIEKGTHDELVAAGGAYQKLFESQLLKM